jgi:hypothetical protein
MSFITLTWYVIQEGMSVLHVAAKYGNIDICIVLLKPTDNLGIVAMDMKELDSPSALNANVVS